MHNKRIIAYWGEQLPDAMFRLTSGQLFGVHPRVLIAQMKRYVNTLI